jgi:FkbM family methyltransferase
MNIIKRTFERVYWLILFFKFKLNHPSVIWFRSGNISKLTFFSQGGQDAFIAMLLFNKLKNTDGQHIIVDVGANHPEKYSNSCFLERFMGCRTLAIEPLAEFKILWNEKRPAAEFIQAAAGSQSGFIEINVPVNGDNMFSSIAGGVALVGSAQRKVTVTKLCDIFSKRKIGKILVLFMDIEGHEIEALQGIDFELVIIDVIVIENNEKLFGTEAVRSFLISKGYVFFARINWLDDVFLRPDVLNNIGFWDKQTHGNRLTCL